MSEEKLGDWLPLKLHTDGVITCADGLSFNSRKRSESERQYVKRLIVDAVNEWHAKLPRLRLRDYCEWDQTGDYAANGQDETE